MTTQRLFNRSRSSLNGTHRAAHRKTTAVESLEVRNLLSTVLGQVLDDLNGNGLRDPGEAGRVGMTIALKRLEATTGASTPVGTEVTDANGQYAFSDVTQGTYLVNEQISPSTLQTFPTAEHTPRSYLIEVGAGDVVVGGALSAPLAAPVDGWLAQLPAGTYSFPVSGDFMFRFGSGGVAPSRVFLTGMATVQTQVPVVSAGTGGESGTETSSTTTVSATMTSRVLRGTVSSDQHEQGYLGTVTMTLTSPSAGQFVSRKDSAALVDSNFDIHATLQIPNSFGVPTTLHTSVPINFLAREIARFPALGSSYQYRGTQPPIALVDAAGAEQGTLYFASLNPLAGLDFGNFSQATVQGRAYIDANTNGVFDAGDTPLVYQPIILQQVAEESGPSGEEGQGGSSGAGGPPDGKGEGPTTPITVYTDSNGLYAFPGLGPGGYTVRQPDAFPLSVLTPNTDGHAFTIDAMVSGSTGTYDFVNEFTAGQVNRGTAPGYPMASHVVLPNLHLGATEFANASSTGESYINDGVRFGSALVPGAAVPLTVTVVVPEGQVAYLSGWLDARGVKGFAVGDGGADHGDQIPLVGDAAHPYLSDLRLEAGVHTLALTMRVPSGLTLPGGELATYARFRLSTTTALGPDSAAEAIAPDGEVQDLPVTIYDPAKLGTVVGQTFEDVDGDGVCDPAEPALDGWIVELVNLDTGEVVATRISGPVDMTLGGASVTEHGIYAFDAVMPGRYEVRATPPTEPGQATVTAPGGDEGAVVYRFDIAPGEAIGTLPYATTKAAAGWLNTLPAGTDTLFTLGQFMILKGGGGGHASGETGGETGGSGDSSKPIRLAVVGTSQVFHDVIGPAGVIPAEITGLQLEGIAVQESDEGGPATVLGPVSVKLGIFRLTGTFGATSGEGGEESSEGDQAAFSLYLEFDLTALGYGKVVNTRPLNVAGTLAQVPMVGTAMSRQGGGSPIPLRDTATGAEPLRLVTGSLATMFGLDYGAAFLGSLSGNVFEDLNGDNTRQDGEGALAGSTIRVEPVVSEEGPSGEEGHGGGSGGSGSGGSGGETTTPVVYLTRTDAEGNWSITGLAPGEYKVTVIPPASYGISGGATFNRTVTIQSRSQISDIDFGNYPVNDPPVIVAPATYAGSEDAAIVFSTASGNAIAVGDPDAGDAAVRMTLTSAHGQVTLASLAGLVFSTGDGQGDSTMTFEGPMAAINAALDGLRYVPDLHYFGTATIDLAVDDLGNAGFDGAKTALTSIAIDLAAAADAPTLVVADATGPEGQAIALPISAAIAQPGGPELLTVVIRGLPAGASLSAGTPQGNGVWSLTPDQLAHLSMSAPQSGTYALEVVATAAEPSNDSTATTTRTLVVRVNNVDPVVVAPGDQAISVGQAVAIPLGAFRDVAGDGPWAVRVDWGDSTSAAFAQATSGAIAARPHAYVHSGRYTVTVTVTDKDGGQSQQRFAVVAAPAGVTQVIIGDGTAQRSRINSMTVVFNGLVDVQPGAFALKDLRGRSVNVRVATAQWGGQTVATLTFGRGFNVASLPNGRYVLTIDGGRILDRSTGQAVDASGQGIAGSHRTVAFHRLLGDLNGDGRLTRADRPIRRLPFGSRA